MIPVAEIAPNQNNNTTVIIAEAVTRSDITNNIQQIETINNDIPYILTNTREDRKAIDPILIIRKDLLHLFWSIIILHIINLIINPLNIVYCLVLLLNILAVLTPKLWVNFIMILSNITSIILIFLSNLLICINLQQFKKDLLTGIEDGSQIILLYFITMFLSSTIVSFMYIFLTHNLIRINILYIKLTATQKDLLHDILN